jgi:hypothetical protein
MTLLAVPALSVGDKRLNALQVASKRLVDVAVLMLVLLLFSPTSLWIALESE